jgi:soluble lytic murein transglycosylase
MSKDAPRRHVFSRWLLVLAALLPGLGGPRAQDAGDARRDAFRQAYAAARQGGDGWRALAANLADYPLYPYLEAAALSHDLRQLDRAAVESYLRRYPGLIPASDLRRDFLLELARRQDWTGFLALYQPGLGDALACDALQARLAQGARLDFEQDLAPLWSKPALPGACDPVLAAAHDQGLLTEARLWARIDLAAAAGQGNAIAALAPWLPADQQAAGQHLAQALRDPAGAVAAASAWPDTPRQRQAAALALQRLARRQSASADSAWQGLQSRFRFSAQQRDDILHALALYHATDFDENALERLAALPPAAQSNATREWRVRVALARQDWPAVLAALDALAQDQRDDGEWRWFRARALDKLGRGDEGRPLLAALAREPTYFGFLAADRLGQPYAICPLGYAADPQRQQALLAEPGLQRAFELYAVDLPRLARREWAQALAGADPDTVRQAVDLAYRRGWYDRAVFTFNSGDALRYYEQRFPLASQDGVVPQAGQAGIDPSWAYAILRAESAWAADARSGADARGLMQLVPGTAEQVARRHGLPWEGGQSLYDPATNIALGTRYLAELAARYGGAPWLASAAYNAGPAKLDQWLAARGSLEPDLFVASIPYKETREYVARVMAFSVIYDWRQQGKAVPLSQRMPPQGQPYRLPDGSTPRKDVTCPAEAAGTPPAAGAPAPAASLAPPSSGPAPAASAEPAAAASTREP